MPSRVIIVFVAAIALSALIWFLADRFPGSLESDIDQAGLVKAVAILAMVGAGVLFSTRLNLKGALRNIVIWLALGALLLTGYTLRDDVAELFDRVGAELVPSQAQSQGDGLIAVRRSNDGHFHVNADVEGTNVQLLVDTGASIVTLNRTDAQRIGINVDELTFSQRFQTANGVTFGAPLRLSEMTIGDIRVTDVRAAVLDEGLSKSLLGLSFLDRVSAFSVQGDELIIRR